MILYIMRHGSTNWNEKGIIQGNAKNRLSKLGKDQCFISALHLKDVKLDVLFCSPVFRTVQSANIVNQFHHLKVIKDVRIQEFGKGIFKGRKKTSLTQQEKQLHASRSKNCGMETNQEIVKRINDFLNFLKTNYKNKTVLVVTHGGPASVLEKAIQTGSGENWINNFNNAEIRKYIL